MQLQLLFRKLKGQDRQVAVELARLKGRSVAAHEGECCCTREQWEKLHGVIEVEARVDVDVAQYVYSTRNVNTGPADSVAGRQADAGCALRVCVQCVKPEGAS